MSKPRRHHSTDSLHPKVRPAILDGPVFRSPRHSYDSVSSRAAMAMLALLMAGTAAQGGDILRGGMPAGVVAGGRSANGGVIAGKAQTAANARDALARTSKVMAAMKDMQAAARKTALQGPNNLGLDPNHPGVKLPNVPNGLKPGGLQVAPGVPVNLASPTASENPALWTGALLPKETTSGGQTLVTIKQTNSQALLTWETFNVGKETTVYFDQRKGNQTDGGNKWIAFNRILDPSGIPSQILGSIKAEGTVYLLNQNGILFGGSSQINLHSLVASSLPINDNLISSGLLINPNAQFLFSALETGGFTPPESLTPDGHIGDVIVQPGAQITSPTTASHVGGRVALIGANVRNSGTISTPDGQTILAAGLQVGIAAHAASDPSLRGLDVFVGAVKDPNSSDPAYAGTATNAGLINAPRADVTITGKDVKQLGTIDSTTSVSLNGRIDLLADYDAVSSGGLPNVSPFLFQNSGTVTLGPNSATQILPELSSTDTVVGSQLALPSQINARGHVVHLASDATVLAPNANVSIGAGAWSLTNFGGGSIAPVNKFVNSSGQIYLDGGAMINVAGSVGINASVAENILSVELRGSELADSPLQREGPFRGLAINIDIREAGTFNGFTWVGTPLADATGYVNLIERTVGALTTTGGTVKLNAGESVVLQTGSTIDVSGGWINYQGGVVETTRVMSGSHLFDISKATPDLIYDGIYTGTFTTSSPKYGVTETFTNPLRLNSSHYEQSYTYGANGGTISIVAPTMALDGQLLGRTTPGERQRTVLPVASTLSLAFEAQSASPPSFPSSSPTPPNITFQSGATAAAAAPFKLDASGNPEALSADRAAKVILSPDLLGDEGFGHLSIANGDGGIAVPAGITLKTSAGGSITLAGRNIDIQGSVIAPGGTLSFTAYDISPYQPVESSDTIQVDPTRGHFTLASDALLSTAGLVVDDRVSSEEAGTLPFAIKGGSITIKSYSVDVQAGSHIDVSGGLSIATNGKQAFGDAGSISISAGQDPRLLAVLGGHLNLDGLLTGFSGARGGSLSVTAPLIQIGGTSDNRNTLLLSPDFFSKGGFNTFSLAGIGTALAENDFAPGLVVAPNTTINPVAQSVVAVTRNGDVSLVPVVKPEGVRNAVSISLAAKGAVDDFNGALVVRGDLVIGENSVIHTDPLAAVVISGNTVDIRGSIVAPGGSITISGGSNSTTLFPDQPQDRPLATVAIGPNSLLSTAGVLLQTPDPRGYRTGTVLPGGTISISGNIIAQAGAIIDVSGTTGILDLAPGYSGANAPLNRALEDENGALVAPFSAALSGSVNGSIVIPTKVDSNGGAIVLKGGQELFTDATLIGSAGGTTALGGTLVVNSGRFIPPGNAILPTALDVTMTVDQNDPTIPSSFLANGKSAIGRAVVDANGNPLSGGHFAVSSFKSSGLDSLALLGTIQFNGPIDIVAQRDLAVADGGVIYGNSDIHLTASHVALGKAFEAPLSPLDTYSPFTQGNIPFNFPPTYGDGTITVTAELIEIGNLSLQGIGKANFIANNGDIRGDGTLDIAGTVTMRAGQVYPPTAVTFTIAAYDYTVDGVTHLGSITIEKSGDRQVPLSAGGTLNLYSSIINQDGVLRAPAGTINLGWDGTGTAPKDLITGQALPITQQVTLGSHSITSISTIDPITGQAVTIPYGISVNGTTWVEPSGTDVTVGGPPAKGINIAGTSINDRLGSIVDLRGGGDLLAYQWVPGVGGSRDILASTTSFAIVPGYQANYSPFAAYTKSTSTTVFGTDTGYVNSTLRVGDSIYLSGGDGLAAGVYTLLPARYALLPGAFLVTPRSGAPVGTVALPDGSTMVSGFRLNEGNSPQGGVPMMAAFNVASGAVVRDRAEYHTYLANSTLHGNTPANGGHLVLSATEAMTLQGKVLAGAPAGSRGGLVDIGSPVDILIAGPGVTAEPGVLVLNSSELSKFGAESLLIGGVRDVGSSGTTVTVKTSHLTVDNANAPLTGADIILVANDSLTLAADAKVIGTGSLSGAADTISLGKSSVPGSGDGVLLRVSSDPGAQIVRTGITSSTTPTMVINAGATIAGGGVILDSTANTTLDSTARLDATAIAINSGRISLKLDNAGTLLPDAGLVLDGSALEGLQSAHSLSLLSYSTLDIYGVGSVGSSSLQNLALHAGELRGFNNADGAVTVTAGNIRIDNTANGTGPGAVAAQSGTLVFKTDRLELGVNSVRIDQFASVEFNATGGLIGRGTGQLLVQGDLGITVPVVTAAKGAKHTIAAEGALTIAAPSGEPHPTVSAGFGASFTLEGASVVANSDILLPSGTLTLHATSGDLVVGGRLDASGTAQTFADLIRYTDGGEIKLSSDHGSVTIGSTSKVTVAAQPGGGSAGTLAISAPEGIFTLAGEMNGTGGAGGRSGSFSLDTGNLPGGSVATLASTLASGGFTQSVSVRDRLDTVLLVDGVVKAHTVSLSADSGAINVTSTIDASGRTGGTINLIASGSVLLEAGSLLNASAAEFNHAGKGGTVSLEAGSYVNGITDSSAVLDIQSGSTIDLSVASNTASSAAAGQFTGTLHLRAPQTAGNTDLQINAINGTILSASSIIAEGYQVFDLTGTDGTITSTVRSNVMANGTAFIGNSDAIANRLLANSSTLAPVFTVRPGIEIVNRSGNLTLGTPTSNASSDWNLATFRFGSKSVPGILTLRAAGDLVFYNALSDGFVSAAYNAQLMAANQNLALNAQSWSYRLSAGADLGAADFRQVDVATTFGTNGGSLLLGKNGGLNIATLPGYDATTGTAVAGRFQVIRTGSGDIDISVGGDLKLLNQFATIYTAGTRIAAPTQLSTGLFDMPVLNAQGGQGDLGAIQQSPAYAVQFTVGGGNVSISAAGDIIHQTRDTAGNLVDDSERELPINWLYRRGYVDPMTGKFAPARFGGIASTTWWVDFSNFFEGVGALGGGNVTMVAGNDIKNVDAVVPTNARMAGKDASGNALAPDARNLVELGGGDLWIKAGRNIDGGVYYVERGNGTLLAGDSITTNATRSPSLNTLTTPADVGAPETWLPTTLFVGKGGFDVTSRGDLLLGPVSNPFLLPEGYSNTYWYKTYFSTYAPDSYVNVSSLGGAVALREGATLPGDGAGVTTPLLQAWLDNVLQLHPDRVTASYYQPWLRLNETDVSPFGTTVSLMPSTLQASAFSGDINLVGNLTLAPSARGTIDLAAAGSINGLQVSGVRSINGSEVRAWSVASVNLSDADPTRIPGVETPFAYQSVVGTVGTLARVTGQDFLTFFDLLFQETGATQGTASNLITKQALHDSGLLHLGDPNPIHLYATQGDISGLTLFSGKSARVVAGRDMTDIALYLQNVSADDVSVVATGRDLIAYDPNSPLRVAALAAGNSVNQKDGVRAGDIQLSGPGTLEVLAGRDLTLGVGGNNTDGTGLGIVTIGNARNPYLPFEGASIVAGAGVGDSFDLTHSDLDFKAFISQFLDPESGGQNSSQYLTELGTLMTISGSTDAVWDKFNELPAEQQSSLALQVFYLVLRDAGRSHISGTTPTDPAASGSSGTGSTPASTSTAGYDTGYAAIDALFPGSQWNGDISITSREIKTKSGGDIRLLAPGGKVTVGLDLGGGQPVEQGILTETGGGIAIFTHDNVDVGTSRIFTLRGGDIVIWSTEGDIAAGTSSKTVQSAPPTRVLVDPQSADVSTDLAGLATGGGIGVLATVEGVPPGDVDLIAPGGTIDAGDAGIRVSGNLNIAAVQVLNASNIQTGGSSTGVPASPTVAAPNLGSLSAASKTAGAATSAANEAAKQDRPQAQQEEAPSVINVEVIGYGGGEGTPDDEEERRKKEKAAQTETAL